MKGSTKVGHFADVSMYQTGIDWDAYAERHHLVVVKATEGRTYTDPTFKAKAKAAAETGLIVGAYHFARPDNNAPEAEAANFVSACRGAGMRAKGRREQLRNRDEIFVLDYETAANVTHSTWVGRFLAEFEKRTGIKREDGKAGLWLYGYGSSLKPIGSSKGMPVWFAAYTSKWRDYYPFGGSPIAHQHTNGQDGPEPHRLAGLSKPHDVSTFFDGTLRELRKLAA